MTRLLNVLLRAGLPLALLLAASLHGADRIIRAKDMTVARGETNRLYISLEGLGNENALGFSVCFDTNLLTLVSVARGSSVSNTTPNPSFSANISQAATQGRVGIAIGLDISTEQAWSAGINDLVEIVFRAVTGSGSTSAPVSFCDLPIARDISDAQANSLPSFYSNALVTIQGPCVFLLGSSHTAFGAAAVSSSVHVIADPGCAWTAQNTNTWITITSLTNGSGDGTVSFDVAANVDFAPRSGTLMIAGQTFTIDQAGFVCTYSIAPANRTHSSGASTNLVDIVASDVCSWTVVNTNDWVVFSQTNGSGSTNIDYVVAANPNLVSRTGTVFIADQVLTLVQDPFVCTYRLSPTNRNHGYAGAANSLNILAASVCPWSATTTNEWITFTSGTNGNGSNTVSYTVAPNPDSTSRSGAIFIADQVMTITQAGAPCVATLTPSGQSHGFNIETGLVNVSIAGGCSWNVVNTNSWITIDSGASGLGNGTVGYTVASNTEFAARSGVLTIASNSFLITQAAVPCPAALSPANAMHGSSAETGSVSVVVADGCVWSASNTNTWITLLSSNGTGTGVVMYAVAANTNITPRNALFTIAGETFTLTQAGAPCAFHLSTTNRNHGYGATSNSVTVTAQAGCAWNVQNTNSWITNTSVANSGSGAFTYAIAANPTGTNRVGGVTIGDQTLIINQAGAPCTFSLSPTNRTHGFAAATNTVTLTTISGCPWTISNLNSWISFPGGTNGSGTATNTYIVAANPDPIGRTGVVLIADRMLTIAQNPAPCLYVLTPASASHGAGVETGLVNVATLSLCTWTATTSNNWIAIDSGTNGSGNGTVGYSVQANTNGAARTGAISVNGQTFTVTQSGAPCVFTLSPTNGVHTFNSETTSVSVTTIDGCAWTVSNTNTWITIRSSTNGTGNGFVSYSVASNNSAVARSGIIVIASQNFNVMQAGAPCGYSLSPAQRTHGPGAANNSVTIQCGIGCDWTASTTNSWLTITSATNGTGTNTISYSIAANPFPAERVGGLLIGAPGGPQLTFVITQRALVCSYTISPTNRPHGYASSTNTISVSLNSSNCAWSASTTNNWISLSNTNGIGDGTITYVLAANPNSIGRTGTVAVADKLFTVTQSGAPCSFTLIPSAASYSFNSETGLVSVSGVGGCGWTVSNVNPWITITSGSTGLTSGTVGYLIDANLSTNSRSGAVTIGGVDFTVTQAGSPPPCFYRLSPSNHVHGFGATTSSVDIVTGTNCIWDVVNTNNWITITTPTNGIGSALLSYALAANAVAFERTGEVFVVDQVLTIIQHGAPCTFDLSTTTRTHGHGAASNAVDVATPIGCVWDVLNTNDWITILSATKNTNTGPVSYAVAENALIFNRTGVVMIADQLLTLVQLGAPCVFDVSPTNRTHGYGAATNSVSVTTLDGCAWSVSNTNDWITILSDLNNTNSGNVFYSVGANPTILARTGLVLVADQVVTLVQQGAPCTFDISPTNRTHGYAAATNTINVAALPGCIWNVTSSNEWIWILSAATGTGSNVITYAVSANPTIQGRTGTVTIADQVLTLVQNGAPCTYDISPTNRTHGFGGATNSVALTTLDGCPWTVLNSNDWITITSETNGTGATNISYIVAVNPFAQWRTGVVVIADQLLTINQRPAPCLFAFDPTNALHSAAGENGTFSVATAADCPWTVVPTVNWITITSATNGIGLGGVNYTVAANPAGTARIGQIIVGDQAFEVTQQGLPCTFALSAADVTFTSAAATGSVNVTTLDGCAWLVTTTNNWITILSGTNSVGSGAVDYAVGWNNSVSERVGFIAIADQTLVVTQQAALCTYVIDPTNQLHGAGVETGLVSIVTSSNCVWEVVNTNSWIAITTTTNGVGEGTIGYSIEANPTSISREGFLVVAGEPFRVTQTGAACTFAIVPTSQLLGAGSETSSVAVTTLIGCTWGVLNTNAWVTILSSTNATNNGTVNYSVTPNPTALPRSAELTIAGQSFTITQAGAACTFALATNIAIHSAGSETGSVAVATSIGCTWDVANTNEWITLLSNTNNTDSGNVLYSVAANPTALTRSGTIVIANQPFTITQAGAACSFSLSAANAARGAGSETGSVAVTTLVGCTWAVASATPWITITSSANNTNSGSVSYSVQANDTALARTGTVIIAGQNFTVMQQGAGCSFSIAPQSATHGFGSETGSVAVTTLVGCVWNVSSTNSWITLLSSTNNTNSGSVTYSVAANPTALSRTGLVTIAGQAFNLIQSGAPCTFAISPSAASHGAGSESGSISITTLTGCVWNATASQPWISITSGLSGANSGTAGYSILANPTALVRTGSVTIAGQSFMITQAGAACTFTISPGSASISYGATNGTIPVTTLTGCTWTAASPDSWITIISGATGSNSGGVAYSVMANPSSIARTGAVNVAGQSFTLTQAGAPCTFSVSPTNVAVDFIATNGTIAVNTLTGCTWTATSLSSWISIASATNGTDSGSVDYSVLANPSSIARTGSLDVAGRNITIKQAGAPCTFELSANSALHSANLESNSVGVITLTGCVWSILNSNTWITITSSTNNTNNGLMSYSVAANPTALTRTGLVTIAGQVFAIEQAGAPCIFSLSASNRSHTASSQGGSVTVTTLVGCEWDVVNSNSWIGITSGLNYSNSGTVTYLLADNSTAIARTGVVTIADITFTVTQNGAACTFSLNPNNATHGAGSETGLVTVTTLTGCPWSVSNANSWITITSATTNNSGTVGYAVASNLTAIPRSGVIRIANQDFTITQAGAPCTFLINPSSASHSAGSETGLVTVTTLVGCTWGVSNANSWISITYNTNNGTVGYTLLTNPTAIARSGVVTVAGQNFTVNQAGAPCTFGISPSNAAVSFGSTNGSIAVTTLTGCTWTATSPDNWITITSGATGSNSGSVAYSVLANPSSIGRTGTVIVAGQSFTLTQAGAPCNYNVGPSNVVIDFIATNGTITVNTLTGCTWTASSLTNWISITSGASSTNSGSVGYSVLANPSSIARTGSIAVAGQNITLAQAGAPCSFVLSANSALHGAGLESNSIAVTTLTGCVWTVSNPNTWITITSSTNNTNSGSVSYTAATNPTGLARTGLVSVAGQVLTITQSGAPCTLALQSSNWVHRALAENGVIGVISLTGCPWTVMNTNGWVNIASGTNGSGGGHVNYSVAANNNFDPRSGFVNISGIAFAITQVGTGCTYRVSPTNRVHGSGANNNTISVTASSGCSWSVLNTNDWITITANASGVGNQTVSYSITKNNDGAVRAGVINIAGELLNIAQYGSNCGTVLSPKFGANGSGTETSTVTVNNSGCAWGTTNTNSWITINSGSGSGNGSVSYTVAANTNGTPRSGVFSVNNALYTVNQAGLPCSFVFSPPNGTHNANSDTGLVVVTTGNGCIWDVVNTNSWITITTPLNNTNSGNIIYTVAPNPTIFSRTGYLAIAGQSFSISQAGANCTYSITPARNAHSYGSDTGSVSVTTLTGCNWSVLNTNNWIVLTISGAAPGATNSISSGTVLYSVLANPNVLGRTGLVTIAGQLFEIDQAGAPCTYNLSVTSASHGFGAESGSVNVTADPLCSWTVSNSVPWITITAGNGGSGSHTVSYSILANPTFSVRSGVIVVAGQQFTISQAPMPCTYVLSPANTSHVAAASSGAFSVAASNGCSWNVLNTNSWITITSPTNGNGNGTVTYNVATNSGTLRVGNIFVSGIPFRVAQAGSVRVVRALDMNIPRGQTNRLLIVLESTGLEKALGMSLCFDTNHLSLVQAVKGIDATNLNASFTLNTNAAFLAQGKMGLALGLDAFTEVVFPPGSNVLAEVYFRATPGTTFTNTTIGLCDSPIARDISDQDANSLGATYVSSIVNILGTCSYGLNTNALSIAANGGSTNINVLSQFGCPWTAMNTNPWIAITSATNGTGNGTVILNVAPNPTGLARSGLLTIAGQVLTVTQAGQQCTYGITPDNRLHTAAAETGSVSVVSITGCDWFVINTNTWVTITSPTNGSASADVTYSVASNTTSAARSAIVTIAGQNFTINQAGAPCLLTISPTNKVHGFVSETGLVSVASPGGCIWTVDNTNTWVLITSSTNGSGNGAVTYTVSQNPDGFGRTGVVMIAGQRFTLSQPANTCPVTLPQSSHNHGPGVETNSFSVLAGSCSWAVSNTNSWITLSATNGTGNGTLTYVITNNPTLSNRTGILRISGREYTVSQVGATCLYGITPSSQTHGFGVETGSVVLAATQSTCDWTVQNPNPWVTINSAISGSGSATILYTITNNPASNARTGVVTIAGQSFTLTQSGAPCTFLLSSSNALHTFALQTNSVTNTTLLGCRWPVLNSNSWITILSLTNMTNSGVVTYSIASNSTALTRNGTVTIGDQPFTISQAGVPCTFTLNPTNRTHTYSAATNTVTVASPIGCPATISNTNDWITILTNGTGGGTGTVTYAVAENPLPLARAGVLVIAGQNFSVTQSEAPCRYTLSLTDLLVSADGIIDGSLNMTTSVGCVWTLVSTNPWIAMNDANGYTNGSGSALFYYLVDQNPSGISRTGVVRIADQLLTIRQFGYPCSYVLSATNVACSADGGNRSIGISTLASCDWNASTSNSWISILSVTNNGNGGSITFAISSNSLAVGRTGAVMIAGQAVTVVQAGITCTYTLSPTNGVIGSGNLTGLVSVASSGGCTWEIANTNTWIAIKSPAGLEGTNNGLVKYTVQGNSSPSARSGNLVIAGIPFNVTQLGSPCSYTLSATGRLHGSLYETGQVQILPSSSECDWSANNTNNWITILSSTNGFGTALISYSVQANTGYSDRTGIFTIADQTYTVTQLGAACNYTLSTNAAFHGALSETGSVTVFMPAGCPYTTTKTDTWITIISTTSGLTNGVVTYSVSPNTTGVARSGVIRIGGQAFTVTQAAVTCIFAVAPTSRSHGFESETNSVSVTTSNVCPWTVLKTNTWITLPNGTNYTGSTNVTYIVAANPSSTARTGVVVVAGQSVTITQAGLVCSYTLSPTSITHGFLNTTGQVALTSPTLCSWTVGKTSTWVTILTPTNNVGPGTVRYSVAANDSAIARTTFLNIAGRLFPISQNGMPFICASNKTVDCAAAWNFDPPVLSGNCGVPDSSVFVVSTTTNFGCGPTYVATRVWDATDACGAHIQCTQAVNVVTPPPLIACAGNKTVECGSAWMFDTPVAAEFCGGTNVSLRVVSTVTTTNGMCGTSFAVTRTWEATDSCSNKATCSQTVTVVDTTPPIATCAPNKTVECGTVWNFDPPTAVDGCSGTNVTLRIVSTVTNVTGACGLTATRTWELTDPCTNRTTCVQVVTVVDTTPPIFNCPTNKTMECGSSWNFDNPSATDNCGTNLSITISGTTTNTLGACGNTYMATRTWQAMDGCGNVSACSQTVRVVDTTPPTVSCAGNKTIEFGVAWNFDAPTGTDACGGTNVAVSVVSTTTNRNGFCGNTFSTTRTWEVADACSNKVTCTQVVTVRDTSPPFVLCSPNKNINCLGTWTFDTPTVLDNADGTNVTITVQNTVTNGTCGSGFVATRTWRATDSCGNSAVCSQTVFGRATVNVSGTIYSPTNYPATMSDKRVAGATLVTLTNNVGSTAADGSYNCVFDAASNVVITPLPPVSGNPADGVTTLDISLVRRHILNVTTLDSPYKLLAADVDGSGTISTLDLSFMRRLVLGITNRFPTGLWRFVPSDYQFTTNMTSPWNAPTNRFYPGVASDFANQDFAAIKLGDVNASWNIGGGSANPPHAAVKEAKSSVGFAVNGATNVPGTSVVVRITVSGFSRVTSVQGTLEWDPSVVRFVGTEEYGMSGLAGGNFGPAFVSSGKLTFSWDDPGSQGLTLADGTVVFAVRFDVVGALGSSSPVALTDSIAVREAAVNFTATGFRSVDGKIQVTDPSALRLSASASAKGTFGIAVPTRSGKSYVLEYTDVLPAKSWTPLPPVIGDGTVKTLSDPAPAPQQRFYRVRVQ